jgi:hypothetical protein
VIRWLRLIATGTLILAMVAIGVAVGLFLVANSGWVAVDIPPWLADPFGDPELEVWLPGLNAGWLTTVFCVAGLLVWSMYYVWRRRQYEALIGRLERELARLRNLPFVSPAPLEDLPEEPDPKAARILRSLDASVQGSLAEQLPDYYADDADDDGDTSRPS